MFLHLIGTAEKNLVKQTAFKKRIFKNPQLCMKNTQSNHKNHFLAFNTAGGVINVQGLN